MYRHHHLIWGVTLSSVLCLMLSLPTVIKAADYNEPFTSTQYRDNSATTASWNTSLGVVEMPYFSIKQGGATTTYSYQPAGVYVPITDTFYLFGMDYNDNGIEAYQINTMTASVLNTTLPYAAEDSAAAYAPQEQRVYIFSGNYSYHSKIQKFDPQTQSVTVISTELPHPLIDSLAVTVQTQRRIYLFGGYYNGTYYDTIYSFNYTQEKLTLLSQKLPQGLDFIGGAYRPADKKIYLFGGDNSSIYGSNAITTFDTITHKVQVKPESLPTTHYALKVVYDPSLDQFILFGGYYNQYSYFRKFYRYNPSTGKIHAAAETFSAVYPYSQAGYIPQRSQIVVGGSYMNNYYHVSLGFPQRAMAQSIQLNHCTIVPSLTFNAAFDVNGVSKQNSVTFYVSNDGGDQWYPIIPRSSFTFPNLDGDLRWRIQLDYTDGWLGPQVSNLSISYNETADQTPPTVTMVEDQGTYCGSGNYLQVQWDAEDSETCVTQYWYSLGTAPGATDVLNWVDSGNTNYFVRDDLQLQHCVTYYVNVKAANQDGVVSSVSSSDGITPILEGPNFSGVTSVQPARDCDSAQVSWNTVTSTGCASAIPIHYNVFRSFNPASGFTLVSDCDNPPTGSTFTDTELTPETDYFYMVKAEYELDVPNGSGGCHGTEDNNVKTLTLSLLNPLSFAGVGSVSLDPNNCGAVKITWALASTQCSSGTLHYHVFRRQEGQYYFGLLTDCNNPVTGTEFIDDRVETNTTYYYMVRVEDDRTFANGPCGGIVDDNTQIASITIPDLSPTFAGLKSALPLDAGVALSWGNAQAACAGSQTHFNIYRSFNPASGFSLITECDSPLTEKSFIDRDVENGTAYFYMVRAEDDANLGAGNGPCKGNEEKNTVILSATPMAFLGDVPALYTSMAVVLLLLLSLMLVIHIRRRNRTGISKQ